VNSGDPVLKCWITEPAPPFAPTDRFVRPDRGGVSMRMASRKLGEFFNIGRDRGWDVARQEWTVHSLVDPEGRVLTLGDVLDGIPLDLRLEKSGSRYGYPPLRQRVVESQRYRVTPEHVLVTSGTQHANFLAFAATLEAGDEAIVESPSWEQPQVLCEAFKVEPRILRRRPELGWRFDLTGAYVLSDEIYRGLEWDGILSPSVVNTYERGITTSSVSKTLGMSGLRLGWLATPDRGLIERCVNLKYYISLHQQSRLDEVVAMAALEPTKYWALVKETMAAARLNYDVVAEWMERNDVFHWVPPRGGFLSFPGYTLDVPSWDLCVRLLDPPYRTYLIPGGCYGHEGHVRLGLGPGTPAATIRAGLAEVDRFVADYRAGRVTL
jgi:aspartate/methionine/tyrosine aminotransferase